VANALVPASWAASAEAKALPAAVSANNGWYDQFLAGYIWDLKATTLAAMLGMDDHSAVGAFIGNALLNAILPAIVILAVIYYGWYRKGYLRSQKITQASLSTHLAGLWSMVTASRRTAIAGLVLGVAAGLHIWVIQTLQLKNWASTMRVSCCWRWATRPA
jgi:hypothetical protein